MSHVTAVDLSPEMLALAKKKMGSASNVQLIEMDLTNLNDLNKKFDVITGGYALRNAPDLEKLIRDLKIKLNPNGEMAFFDFSKSPSKFISFFQILVLKIWCTFWSLILHRRFDVYGYIPKTLSLFPDRIELHQLFLQSGFRILKSKSHFGGLLESIWLAHA
jgi:demethylmenaquinone methyltransferase/2-methoxy-6-polyprenyl-1,4-benzoquinol methylase